MAFDLDTCKRITGRLDLDGIDFEAFREEGRHIDFYRHHAVEQLERSEAARRTTRRVIEWLWQPVGSGVMPREETAHLVRTLFGGPDGEPVAARIDRRIDAVPGLHDLGLMRRTIEAHATAA